MVVKSSNEYKAMVGVVFFGVIPVIFVVFMNIGGSTIALLLVLIITILILRFWVAVGRVLVFDENGCTVKFLWFSRSYTWEELNTKHIVDMKNLLGYRQPYSAGAIFSTKDVRIPKLLMPAYYCAYVHPFEFFFVYFDPKLPCEKWDTPPFRVYVVDENDFLSHMENWGVELHRAGNG